MTLGKLRVGVRSPRWRDRRRIVFRAWRPGRHWHNLMAAVGSAVMDAVLAPGFLQTVEARGAYVTKGLASLSARHGLGEVRGRGLLIALDLNKEIAPRVVELARDAGLLLNAPRPNMLRFMPALNLSQDEADTMLKLLDGVLKQALTEDAGK